MNQFPLSDQQSISDSSSDTEMIKSQKLQSVPSNIWYH